MKKHPIDLREQFKQLLHPHIGMRKIKSVLAVFVGFCVWQLIRLFLPELEVHPVYIYMYGLLDIRNTSESTNDYIHQRLSATLTAVLGGLPFMLLCDWLMPFMGPQAAIWLQIGMLVVGALVILCLAELTRCKSFCGVAAIYFISLMLRHFDDSGYLYSVMRVVQTFLGVFIAWLINVKLFPYHGKDSTTNS
jgi:uncharacterized membrane protein YgaE (UPF0421/DUF939 family)